MLIRTDCYFVRMLYFKGLMQEIKIQGGGQFELEDRLMMTKR